MAFTVKKKVADSVFKTIEMEDGSFKVKTRRPTWSEKLTDEGMLSEAYGDENAGELRGQSIEHRIRCTIIGWEDINGEDGSPLEFSWKALVTLCEQYQSVFYQFYKIATESFRGVNEETEKNSVPPSNDSSEDRKTAETTSDSSQSSVIG